MTSKEFLFIKSTLLQSYFIKGNKLLKIDRQVLSSKLNLKCLQYIGGLKNVRTIFDAILRGITLKREHKL